MVLDLNGPSLSMEATMEAGMHHTRELAKSSLSLLSGLQGPPDCLTPSETWAWETDVGGALMTSAGP